MRVALGIRGAFLGFEHRDPGAVAWGWAGSAPRSPTVWLSQAGSSRNFSRLQLLCSTFYYN